ncbi:MAG: AtpZ/AtpI family protein [Alphaproteobacteria bacterium]|nr:AtpZ/AtpI family protein [Alphaproteobacteria bacterium]
MKKSNDIAKLEKRISAFKKNKEAQEQRDAQMSPSSNAAKGFQMSVELVSAIAVGAAIGYFLDDMFDTFPVFLCILTILGGAAGVLNMYRTAKEQEKGGN